MKSYRVAIIGLGGMGGHHAEAVQAEENCVLVGGAEIDAERGRAWGARFGVEAIYDDYQQLLDAVAPGYRPDFDQKSSKSSKIA